MGVEYSTTVGYGFALKEEELGWLILKSREKSGDEYFCSDDIEAALKDEGYSIEVSEEGDYMSGDTYYLFYDKSHYHRLSPYYEYDVHINLTDVDTNSDTVLELYRLAARFDIKPGWHVFNNVS